MRAILSSILILISDYAICAYPPFAQDAFYIGEILANKQVIEQLGVLNRIDGITRNGDSFVISAGHCHLEIILIPKEDTEPVPPSPVSSHELKIGKILCNRSTNTTKD